MMSLIVKLKQVFTPNRIAAIATWCTGLAGFIVGITGTLPHAWQNYATIAAGLLTKVVVAVKFMDGSQKWEAFSVHPETAALVKMSNGGDPGSVVTDSDAALNEGPPLNDGPQHTRTPVIEVPKS